MKLTPGCTILILFIAATALGQTAKIEGQVYDHREKPVAAVKIVVIPGGQEGTTDSTGHFNIRLPIHILPGQAAKIRVQKLNWVIRNPVFGECATQSVERHIAPLRVVIVPKGSLSELTPKELEEFVSALRKRIMRLTEEAASQKRKLTNAERQFAKYAFIEEYAREYGLPIKKLEDTLKEWSRIKESDDKIERAAKEYLIGNLEVVIKLTEEAGPDIIEQLKLDNERRLERSRDAIKNFTLKGTAFFEQEKFREALNSFTELEQLFDSRTISKEDFANDWADLKLSIANTKVQLGITVAGTEGPRLLNEALNAHHPVAAIYIRELSPDDWAAFRYGRAYALFYLGVRTVGAKGIEYLKEAEADLRAVLAVKTRERSPRQWVWTQNQLANVLRALGKRSVGSDSLRYLKMAEEIYRAALEVTSSDVRPKEQALTQHNLGLALRDLGTLVAGAESQQYLRGAVDAHRAAMKFKTRQDWPEDWALAQEGLGNALYEWGHRTEGEAGIRYLKDSVVALRAALEIRTREKSPQDWASTQGNLAKIFSHLGERTSGNESVEFLNEAVSIDRAALEVFTCELWPAECAELQSNLAGTLITLGDRTQGATAIKHFKDADAAIRSALEVFTIEGSPQSWARTQQNQGVLMMTLVLQSRGGPGSVQYLSRAVTSFNAALEVFKRSHFPQLWALTQNNLANALRLSGVLVHGTAQSVKYLREAEAVHRSALEVYTRSDFPQQWANTQINLGSVYFVLEDWPMASESFINGLEVSSDNAEAYRFATHVNHEKLFRFDQAFELHRRWATRHETSVAIQADFAEAHFTTGRFGESQRRIASLLALPEDRGLPANERIAIRAIEIASLLALGQEKEVSGRLAALVTEVSQQPAEYTVQWNFKGTTHFIEHSDKLSAHRQWLTGFFAALAGENRDKILTALKAQPEIRY